MAIEHAQRFHSDEEELVSTPAVLRMLVLCPRLFSQRLDFAGRLDLASEFADPALAQRHSWFTFDEIKELCLIFELPDTVCIGPRHRISSLECFAIMLNRLATGANQRASIYQYLNLMTLKYREATFLLFVSSNIRSINE